jgi:TonB family protein
VTLELPDPLFGLALLRLQDCNRLRHMKAILVAAFSLSLLSVPACSAQTPADAPAPQLGKIRNIAPEETWKRVTQCLFPTYPSMALHAHITGTVDIAFLISPGGAVVSGRVLAGDPSLSYAAVAAIQQWNFEPTVVRGETWTRIRALVRFNPDGTTAVDLVPAILADDFGDPGIPAARTPGAPPASRQTGTVSRPASAPECKSEPPWTGAQPKEIEADALSVRALTSQDIPSLQKAALSARALTSQDIPSLQKDAESGDAQKQNLLGTAYRLGTGVPMDYSKALYWLRRAAEQGLATAQTSLGLMYGEGQGIATDDAESMKWFRKAAEQNFPDALILLGTMYENGQSVPADSSEAVRWYRRAAEKGFAAGQRFLGDMYASGKGVPKDYEEAAKWYRLAAEQGDAVAQKELNTLEKDRPQTVPAPN